MTTKKTLVRRALSLLLTFLMVISLVPVSFVPASAAEIETVAVGATATPYDGVPVTPEKITSSNYQSFGLTDGNWSAYDGYYAIRNAKELYGFANLVNGGDAYANAILTDDIIVNSGDVAGCGGVKDETWRSWTPIGFEKQFRGVFDGNGHYISGLYYNESTTYNFGLVGNNYGTIRNVTVKNTYFSATQRIGAICGWNEGLIENCANIGSYCKGDSVVGGIAAVTSNGTIRNCYNSGTVDCATKQAGGITGYFQNVSAMENCFSCGVVYNTEKPHIGALVGIIPDNVSAVAEITNCYYDKDVCDDAAFGFGGGENSTETIIAVEGKTSAQCASGEVAYLLQGEQTEDIWGQEIGTEDYPELGGAKVYCYYTSCGDESAIYTNTMGPDFERPDHIFDDNGNGFCSVCENGYEAATLNEDGYYEIGNAGQLYWFAEYVNAGNTGANAILMSYIDQESYAEEYGNIIIGTADNNYKGTFDGNGYKVTVHLEGAENVSLFGYLNGATIKNLEVSGTIYASGKFAGGIASYTYGNTTIEKCKSSVVIESSVSGDGTHGGFVGVAESGTLTINNCVFTGAITGSDTNSCGGFVGWSNATTKIDNSYQNGQFELNESECYNFGRNPGNYTITNCFYIDDFGTANSGSTQKTAEQFASGEVAYLLQGQQTEDIWGQKIGTDTYPILGGLKVYQFENCIGEIAYSNTNENIDHVWENGKCTVCEKVCEHTYENGFCTACGAFEPATDVDNDGVYEIGNAGQLYWFAEHVNAGNTSANAILTADIVVNEGVMDETCTGAREWMPIGYYDSENYVAYKYTGTFDGNNHTVSGIYFNNSEADNVGLFGYVGENGTVKNTGVINSYFNAYWYIGGVVGWNYYGTIENCYNTGKVSGSDDSVGGVVGSNYYGTITNCYNEGEVSGSGRVGGVVGSNYYGTITNCYNTGDVCDGDMHVGGVVGRNYDTITDCYNTGNVSGSTYVGGVVGNNDYGTIENCYNTGEVRGNYDVGGVVGGNYDTIENCYNTGTVSGSDGVGGVIGRNYGTTTNCYYLDTVYTGGIDGGDVADSAEAKTAEQCASGEVAHLLGEAFGQKIGTDAYPILGGDKVYAVTNCKDEVVGYSNTNESGQHNVVDGACANCGLSSTILSEIELLKRAIAHTNEKADENNVLESKKEPLNFIYQELMAIGKREESGQVSSLELVKISLSSYMDQLENGIADGTWIKADYTEIDAAVAEIESGGATTDKVSAKLEEIKSEISVMKESSETSKADVAVLMKEVEALKDCVSGNHIFENGFCTICGEEEPVDKLAGYTISLGDKIAVNYYMSLTEKTVNDENAKMVFTVPDTASTYTVEIPVSSVTPNADGYYVFTCEVSAKDMTSVIKAQFITSDKELALDDYSVQEYAEVILSDTVKYEKEQELVKAMLNYGAQAQIYFGYNTDNLANDTDYMNEEEKVTELYGFAGAPFTLEGEEAGVTYYGTSLVLETEVAFKHYFIIDEGIDVDSLEITCDYPVTLKKSGNLYVLKISNIPANQIGKSSMVVSIGGITLDYTIYSYGALAQSAGKTELWTVLSALAHYANAASLYAK